jgi:hypothetical protein
MPPVPIAKEEPIHNGTWCVFRRVVWMSKGRLLFNSASLVDYGWFGGANAIVWGSRLGATVVNWSASLNGVFRWHGGRVFYEL